MRKYFIILAVIGFLLYLPSLKGPFLWDDEDFVYANKYVENFQIDKFFTDSQTAGRGKLSNYYRPIPQIVYASTHSVMGFNPFWYHLVNVLAHISATIAIFYFFTLLLNNGVMWDVFSGSDGKSLPHQVPFLISLFFLLHPVQTEAVSYISGLSDPLFVLFGFLSLIFFLTNRSLLSAVCFVMCLLSKETGIVFLPLLVVLNIIFTRRVLVNIVPTIKMTLSYFLITVFYLWYHLAFISKLDMSTLWGNTIYSNSVTIRLLTFIQNLYTYFSLLIFPKNLFMERDYSIHIQTSFSHWSFILSLILFPLIFYLIRKSKILVFCFLGFFISLLPYSGLILINGIFYEHFLYLPLVFFFAFIFILTQKGFKHWPATTALSRRRLVYGVIIVWILLLIIRNISRQFDWIDPIKFYSQTLSHAPQSIRIINGLAMAYADKGDSNNAIRVYSQGISINSHIPNLYHNLANVYLAQGNIKSAEENYIKAITVDPSFTFSWQSLANLYQQTNQVEKLQKLIEKFKGLQMP